MTKKYILVIALILMSFCFITTVFANEDMDKLGENAKNTLENVGESARNVVGGAEGALENAGDDIKNVVTNDDTARTQDNIGDADTGDYAATRTATDTNNLAGMNSTAWTWIIIAVTALIIIGLIWYFATQNTDTHYNDR